MSLSKSKDQAIQESVARAMLFGTLIALAVVLFSHAMTGQWLRLERNLWLALLVLPVCLYSFRLLQRNQPRRVILFIGLISWLGLSAQIITSGTVINASTPALMALGITGFMAKDRLLSWLLALLCVLTMISVVFLSSVAVLSMRIEPSQTSMLIGILAAFLYLGVLAHISNRHLQVIRQRERTQSLELQRLSSRLHLAIEAGGITCFNLDLVSLRLELPVDDRQLFGVTSGVIALDQVEVFSLADRQRIAAGAEHAHRHGRFPELTCQLQSGPGQGRWYRLYAACDRQAPTQLICAMQDIDEQKKAELAKENFTAMVSHELRTPLTALLGSLRLLQGLHMASMGADAQKLLQMGLRGGERLATLVNDILDYFRLQAGGMPVQCQQESVASLLQAGVDAVQALLQERDLQLHMEADSELEGWLDSKRAQQVLINLLSNAIKFSPQRGELYLRSYKHSGFARVSLQDCGPGISAEFSKRIFEPFSQASDGNTRDSNSTGLGLVISRQLMRQMGGELSYCSPPGEGATFHMDFLLEPDPVVNC